MDLRPEDFRYDVVVVGGAGHVGLPLAIAFASRGLKVCIYDINEKAVAFRAGKVLCTDPYVTVDDSLIALDDVLAQADILIIGAPHGQYATLTTSTEMVDVWNLLGQGTKV